MMNEPVCCKYSKELDDELKLLLETYRDGELTVEQLLKLIEAACRDHLDFTMLGSLNGRLHRKEE